ncbi:MAG TPA: amino acid permease [Pyrinomonadaceae bacterium]|nr:amino acid permease [Pyrinomonadaceae bacterium]
MDKSEKTITLIRGLTLVAAVSIIIGNVIGTGVFLKARVMTCNVGTPGMVVTVWVVAGFLSLAGALTYAELSAMMPRAGGEYVFVREAYGSGTGFLYGWMQVFIAKTGSQASVAVALAIFFNDLTGGSLNPVFFTREVFGHQFNFGMLQVVALSAIAIFTALNCAAVSVSGWIATVLTGVKIALVLGIGVGAFLFASGNWGHFAMSNTDAKACEGVAQLGIAGFSAAMLGALWGYDGWNNLTLAAGEVKNPQRNVPLALIGGTAVIILLYVFVNIAYFYVLDPTAVAGVSPKSSVAREVVVSFLGPVAVSLMAAGLLASSIGTLHTSILTGARVPYAMARDGMFFQNLARLSRKTRVPVGALVVQGVWASLLALSGSFDALTDYVVFGSWIFYGLVTASIFLFRRRQPHAERPYRAWGYPVVPVLFLLVTAFLLITTLLPDPARALAEVRTLLGGSLPTDGIKGVNLNAFIGIVLIAAGLPVYYLFFRHRRIAAEDPYRNDE